MNKKSINTIYIISKGRPSCRTARTLTELEYPGEWFIVCGTNDDKLKEYQDKWGKRVLVFDFNKELETIDTLDNFGFDSMPSGATPVRNATRGLSDERGELRHWQFDDDYTHFRVYDHETKKNRNVTGAELENVLFNISTFAHNADVPNTGFAVATDTFPEMVFTFSRRVFNAHNLTSDKTKFVKWRSRMNDDLINAIEVYYSGKTEYSFKFLGLAMPPTQSEEGGLTEFYEAEGTVRKTAYAVLIAPQAVKLVQKFGRYHHKVNWEAICPKLIHEKYAKN